MAIVYRLQKGSSLSYAEMDGNFSYLDGIILSSVTGSYIDGVTQTFQLGDGTSYTNTIVSASHAISASYSVTSSHTIITTATNAVTASYALTASSLIGTIESASYALTASSVTGTIESASYSISSSHTEFADDAASATSSSYSISGSHAEFADNAASATSASFSTTASFVTGSDVVGIVSDATSASYALTASYATNANTEWNGKRNGDAEITGSLIISGSNIGLNVLGSITGSSNVLITKASTTSDEEIRIGTDSQDNVILKGGQIIVDDSSTGAVVNLKNRLANSATRPTLGQIQFYGKDSDIGSGLKGQIRGKFTGGSKQEMAMEFYSTASGAFGTFQDADIDLRLSSGSSIEVFRDTTLANSDLSFSGSYAQPTEYRLDVRGSTFYLNRSGSLGGGQNTYQTEIHHNGSSTQFKSDGSVRMNLNGNVFEVQGDIDATIGNLVTNAISASYFSGSFFGDGSGLTNLPGGSGDSDWYDGTTYLSSSVETRVTGNISGSNKLIIGSTHHNVTNNSSVAGGQCNSADGITSIVGGGFQNYAGDYAFVGGGTRNSGSAQYATIAGGSDNCITNQKAFIGGGEFNIGSGAYSTIGGGYQNSALASYATIGGGEYNEASGIYGTVAGGSLNKALDTCAFVGGGCGNKACCDSSTIAGGKSNIARSNYSFIGGGQSHNANNCNATIAGGGSNTVLGCYGSIGGGFQNRADGAFSFVGNGHTNRSCGFYSSIVGGVVNTIDSSTTSSFIGGGRENSISANSGSILGGYENCVNHANSHIIGSQINSTTTCTTFVNNLYITGSTSTNSLLTLARLETTPGVGTLQTGSIFHSGSGGAGCLYFSPDGSAICKISFA